MGLRDRILDYIAKVFMPVPDHPARGGMTGEATRSTDGEDEAAEDGAGDEDEAAGDGADTAGDRAA